MTVKELIEKLKEFPQEAEVEIAYKNIATDHWNSDSDEEDCVEEVRLDYDTVLICNLLRKKD